MVLLGLLALSYGFKIERRGRGGKGKGGGRGPPEDGGRGPPDEDNDDGNDDGNDDDFDDDDFDDDMDKDKRPDLPRLIVGVIAKRIQMQLDNCDLSEFDGQPSTIKGAIQSLAELLLMDCGAGPSGPPPTGSPSPPTGSTGNPPSSTDGTLPARELEDKVVRELLTFIEKNRH